MLMYLQRHYSGNITLDEIAAYTGISRSECCRYFRKKSGQTIFGYLNRYRIHKSMELMAGTDGDIAQTAQIFGSELLYEKVQGANWHDTRAVQAHGKTERKTVPLK